MSESFEKFMKSQCEDCAFEFMNDAEYCTECGLRFKDAYTAGLERAAEIAEVYRAWYTGMQIAAAIRKEMGE